ncbi:MAG: substrate-binding periplasmic protein [Pseudomonadales bacterium]
MVNAVCRCKGLLGVGLLGAVLSVVTPQVSAQTLRVALDEYPPWNITTGKRAEGINVEVMRRLSQRLKVDLEFVVCPWKRCLKMMEVGAVDMLPGVLKRPEREAYMHFLAPAYKTHSNKAFYLRSDNPFRLKRYQDLAGQRIGVLNGARYFNAFDDDRQLHKVALYDTEQQVDKLLKEQIDVFIGTETQVDYFLSRHTVRSAVIKAQYKYQKPTAVYITLAKRSAFTAQLPMLEKVLGQMVASGEVRRIIDNFHLNTGK